MKPACILVLALLCLLAPAGCGARPALSSSIEGTAANARLRPSRLPEDRIARVRAIMQSTMRGAFLDRAGIAIADQDGALLYGRNEKHTYKPASTMKTLIAATSLATLGAEARLDTTIESLDLPDPEGRVDDLWLVGRGDPYFDPQQLREGIGEIVRKGVRRVDGDLIVDASAFRGPEQNPAWAPDDFDWDYAAGTSAISLNWDVIEIRVEPTQIGAPARVSVFPPDPSVVIRGVATTGTRTTLSIERIAPGRNEFKIEGAIAAGPEQSFYRPALDIPRWVGNVTAEMLRERGIEITGSVRLGHDPLVGEVLWSHRSPALRAMIRQMLVESDNHIAEQLLRIVGAQDESSIGEGDGSTLAGSRVERAYLAKLGVETPGLQIVDGSGLAETDRVAPLTFVRLLSAVARSPIGATYISSFPRAGMEGTVRYHDLNAALGKVRAKSGHIAGVNALVGYVQTRTCGRLAFAFIANGPDADDSTSVGVGVDRALDELAQL